MASPKRFVLAWNYSVIEPLFALYLGGLLRDKGHAWTGVPIRKYDFAPLFRKVEEFGATDVGFNVYSGNHLQFFAAADELRRRGVRVHIGGPHATYFAATCAEHADWVYKGQSFDSFAAVLDDDAHGFVVESLFGRERARLLDAAIQEHKRSRKIPSDTLLSDEERGVHEAAVNSRVDELAASAEGSRRVAEALSARVLFRDWLSDTFPRPDRVTFYRDNPDFARNPIKNTICGEGCPFACTYCYNVAWNSPEMYGRFQRRTVRRVDDVIAELAELKQWDTQLVYVQDDVFGFELKWLREFMPRYRDEVGIPMHAQLRLELARGPAGIERLRLMKLGGCTGVTVAIESGSYEVRKEVLDRPMKDVHVYEGCRNIREAGMTLRTEQILGVPTMATRAGGSVLDVDLLTLRVNVLVKPEISWSAILAPYGGTELGRLCARLGLYPPERLATNDDVSDSFFDGSVLDYSPLYKDQVRVLQRLFSTLAHLDRGDEIARRFLTEALPRHAHETIELFLGPAKEIAKFTKVTLYDCELYRTRNGSLEAAALSAGVGGTNKKSGEELLALLDGAAGPSLLDGVHQQAWNDTQRAVLEALSPLWLRVPRGDRIARHFLEELARFSVPEQLAFAELSAELGQIARTVFALGPLDREAEIAASIAEEKARFGSGELAHVDDALASSQEELGTAGDPVRGQAVVELRIAPRTQAGGTLA